MAAAPSSSSSSDSDASSNRIHHEEDFKGHDDHGHHNDENVLQKHVAFFDRNKDGVIYPWETFQGFRAIGCGIFLSAFASVFINMGLSSKTRPGKFPSLLFPIVVKNIHKSKHGSDSGVYDAEGREGADILIIQLHSLVAVTLFALIYNTCLFTVFAFRFVPEKFEEIFRKHARSNSNALTSEELSTMLKENRVKKDYKGWLASYTEWKILYILCKDENGLLRKDTVRAVYDGSLFEKMAMEKASSKKKS